ncbi:MAG TPA: hypothetical protein VFO38_04920 [Candidatus Saccharimonadales bacterium]|nr:hypothetical protein [Candidatus Saccharimonadales bacterium]
MEVNERQRRKVAAYAPSLAALEPIRKAPLLFVCGIVGAGKDSTLRQVMATYPGQYQFIVSHVTRPPRVNNGVPERDGDDYHFIDFNQAERMLDNGEYIEAAIVHAKHIYGTSIAEVKRIYDAGKIAFTDVTVEGAGNYINLGLNARPVFLLPPDYPTWRMRLEKRGRMAPEELKRRLQSAVDEISYALSVPFFYFVINNDLENTAKIVNRIGHGEPVDRRYPGAIKVAENLLDSIKQELKRLG